MVILRDVEEVNDAWIRPAWRSASERENNPLARLLTWLKDHPLDKNDERFRASGSKHPWDHTEGEGLLATYADHLGAIDELLTAKDGDWLWPQGPEISRIDASADYLNSVQLLGQLLVIRSKAASATSEAIQRAGECLRFGAGMAGAEGGVLHILVSHGLEAQALEAMSRAVTRPDVRDADLAIAYAALKSVPVQPQDLAFALKVEHEMIHRLVWDLAAGKSPALPPGSSAPPTFLMSPNRAIRLSMDMKSPLHRSLEHGWAGIGQTLAKYEEEATRRKAQRYTSILTHGLGGMLVMMAASGPAIFVPAGVDTEVQRVLAMTQIALRRHELATGSLPESLGQISPMHLDGDLRDPWSQERLIWNKQRLQLYSVARNGRDDGGLFDAARPRKGSDRGGAYWWAPPGGEPVPSDDAADRE